MPGPAHQPAAPFMVRQARRISLVILLVSPLLLFGGLLSHMQLDEYLKQGNSRWYFVLLYRMGLTVFYGGGLLCFLSGVKNLIIPRKLLVADEHGLSIFIGWPGLRWLRLPWPQVESVCVREVIYNRRTPVRCLGVKPAPGARVADSPLARAALRAATMRDKHTPAGELPFNAMHYTPPVDACVENLNALKKHRL